MLLLVLFIMVFISFLEIQKKEINYFFYLIVVSLVVLDSIKLTSGTDYFFYFNDYHKYLENINYVSRYELIYLQISKICAISKVPYHLFLFGLYSIYYFLIGYTIKRYSPYPIISVFLFFCITIGLLGSNRQLMAMAIVFFATYKFVEIKQNYKYLYFLLALIIASGFHYSAFLALPIILFNKKITERTWGIIFVISIMLVVFSFNNYIVFKIDKYLPAVYSNLINKYRKTIDVVVPISYSLFLGIIRRGFLVLLFIIYKEKLQYYQFYRILYNISWFSLIFYVFFFTMPFLGSRAGNYFLIFESISYVLILQTIKSQKLKLFFGIFILILGIFLFFKNISIYPHLFIPYKTIFGVF